MGDRGNIVIKQPDGGKVYLYSHWGGSELPEVAKAALAKRWRWTDPAYLTRIVFCEMIKGSELDETGYGISTGAPDNEHHLIEIDCDEQTVTIGDKVYTFEQFIA